ncbi:AMP-binding protein [Paenalcaligenes niemegkensis]|uniref:AMP-binding protein n=1 Tax=Paenalcaligenes niemegkensis TaxID=2895469 RepID=UPI001EE81155|nr:AMP-binding protein [Paenalcaligenes niemegkensis]MCQ9615475.1 AMP-binding protein [Paenalcaligenes niemegkensis]
MRQHQSYVQGSTETALLENTIGNYFDTIVERHPDNIAVICHEENVRYTWAELQSRVDHLAIGLLSTGLQKGDRLALWAPNRAEWLVVQLASAKAGLILVNINPASRSSELKDQLNAVSATALILQHRFKSSHYVDMVAQILPEILVQDSGTLQGEQIPSLRHVMVLGPTARHSADATAYPQAVIEINSIIDKGASAEQMVLGVFANDIQASEPCNIQFSSAAGTEAAPVTLSHHNILNNGFFIGETIKLTRNDKICLPVPLFHCFGMVMGNLACISHGSTMVYPAASFDPLATLEVIQKEHCTGVYGVPAMFIGMLEQPGFAEFKLDSLRTGIMAGAPCPSHVMQQVIDNMHMHEVVIAYGMTESSPVSFMSDPATPIERRVSTVGTVMPHVEAKVITGNGLTAPLGESGELCVRGYHLMQGYWERPELTAAVIDEQGWLHTGDLAVFDEQGFCRIVGNAKDMIIRGGENIYLAEVATYLNRHPAIDKLHLIGVPDSRMGEELCACVLLRPGHSLTEAELRHFCQDQIAHYKIPRHLRIYDVFPEGDTTQIRQQLADDFAKH